MLREDSQGIWPLDFMSFLSFVTFVLNTQKLRDQGIRCLVKIEVTDLQCVDGSC